MTYIRLQTLDNAGQRGNPEWLFGWGGGERFYGVSTLTP